MKLFVNKFIDRHTRFEQLIKFSFKLISVLTTTG